MPRALKQRPRTTAKRAWVVTWVGTTALPGDKVVAVLNYRRSARSVADVVEQLYVSFQADHEEKLMYANTPKDTAYRAQTSFFQGITCGHNPWLYARIVTDLKILDRKMSWTEPRPESELRKELEDQGYFRK